MDPILSSLNLTQLGLVEDQLTNNDVSSDEELCAHLISNGLSEEQAKQALRYRQIYLIWSLFLEGHTPILKGYEALVFAGRDLQPFHQYLDSLGERRDQFRDYLAVLDEQPRR